MLLILQPISDKKASAEDFNNQLVQTLRLQVAGYASQ